MSIGRTREEQELTHHLVKTLVIPEVLRPMDAIGWTHASPPPPDYSGQPTPAEGAPIPAQPAPAAPASGQPATPAQPTPAAPATVKADAPATPPGFTFNIEDFKNPSTGLYFDKYPNPTEAMKGLGHLANMAKQSFQQRDEALQRLASFETGSAPVRPSPGVTPTSAPASVPADVTASRAALDAAQARLDAVLSGMEGPETVIDAETLKKVMTVQREVADRTADLRVKETLHSRDSAVDAKQARWNAVDSHMRDNYPGSLSYATEIGLHIQSDPLLNDAVGALVAQGKEIQASELAWKSYQQAVHNGDAAVTMEAAKEKEADLTARGQVRQELLDKARIDAGVVQGSAGGVGIHENGKAVAPSGAELEAMRNQMRMEGDAPGSPAAMRFRHLLIGQHLDPSIFGPR